MVWCDCTGDCAAKRCGVEEGEGEECKVCLEGLRCGVDGLEWCGVRVGVEGACVVCVLRDGRRSVRERGEK